MTSETSLTITGNLTGDPELRYTPTGAAVATFTVATTPRYQDRATREWRDGNALFLRCTAWRDLAEHIAESLTRGTRVMVTGKLRQRSYETPQGDRVTVIELTADEAGPSLRFATAKVTKATRVPSSGSSPTEHQPDEPAGSAPYAEPSMAAASGAVAAGTTSSAVHDQPPF
jgi:single-strand DNA-binding protein